MTDERNVNTSAAAVAAAVAALGDSRSVNGYFSDATLHKFGDMIRALAAARDEAVQKMGEARESFEDLSAEYKIVSFSLNKSLRDCRMRRLEAETERDKFAAQRDAALAEVAALRKESEMLNMKLNLIFFEQLAVRASPLPTPPK